MTTESEESKEEIIFFELLNKFQEFDHIKCHINDLDHESDLKRKDYQLIANFYKSVESIVQYCRTHYDDLIKVAGFLEFCSNMKAKE